MLEIIVSPYLFLFGRARFQKLNKLLYRLSLASLGILNYKNINVSGEKVFLKNNLAKKKGIIIDVGANQGDYSLEAIAVNDSLKVYSFEPHPVTFNLLNLNISQYVNKIFAYQNIVALLKK